MELLLLRLPNDLELMARWFAEDGEAEDTLNHCLTYRRAYRHLLPQGAEPQPQPNNNTVVCPHAASAQCALARGTHAPEQAAPPDIYEDYLRPDPYLQAEPYQHQQVQEHYDYAQPEPVMQMPRQEHYPQAEPVYMQPPPPVQPEPVMQMPQQPVAQQAPYIPQAEPVYIQQPPPVQPPPVQPEPVVPAPPPVMQMQPEPYPQMQMQQDPYAQQSAAVWSSAPPQMEYPYYDSMPMEDTYNPEAADDAEKKTTAQKAMGIVSKTTTIFVIALMAVSIIVFLLPRIFGMELRAVVSPSMEPVHPVGAVVVIRPRPFEQIGVGDDITFVRDAHGTIVTHRVIARNTVDRTLTTQGLTNAAPDAPVGHENVIGVVWFSVPVVGYAFIWLEPTVNKVIVAIVIVAIWLALFLVEKAVAAQKKTQPEVTNTIYT